MTWRASNLGLIGSAAEAVSLAPARGLTEISCGEQTYAAGPALRGVDVRVQRMDALTPAERAAWEGLRGLDPRFDSPFFSPDFALALAHERTRIEVAIVEQAGRPVAFLPFRRAPFGIALPPAGPFGDFDGLVASPSVQLDVGAVLRAAGLACFVFEHAAADDAQLISGHVVRSEAPFIDASAGFEGYAAARNRLGGRELKGTLRKARRAESEVGALRFEPNLDAAWALDRLLDWKREQIRARGLPDPISKPWAVRFVKRVAALRTPGCSGMLSGLFLGDRLAAMSLGIRSHSVLHGWITVYDPLLARHSPGALLLIELVRSARSLGIARIDMGPGHESYKWRFNTGARSLAGGAVHASRTGQRAVHAALHLRERARKSPLLGALRRRLRGARGEDTPPSATEE